MVKSRLQGVPVSEVKSSPIQAIKSSKVSPQQEVKRSSSFRFEESMESNGSRNPPELTPIRE
jgi:hypothetical protein